MNIDYSKRQSGKTTRMIDWIKEDPLTRYLITYSSKEENRLKNLYPNLERNIYSFDNWIKAKKTGGLSGGHSKVSVDNADYILEKILGTYVDNVSINKEEIELR